MSGETARPGWWASGKALRGKRIVVTRAEEQASGLVERLRALGAEPTVCAAIRIGPAEDVGPLDAAIARLHEYDWLIVTSANGVRALLGRMGQLEQGTPTGGAGLWARAGEQGRPPHRGSAGDKPPGYSVASKLSHLRIGAIGPATARELERHGLRADFVPSAYVAESILAEIGNVTGRRILLPRADIARETLAVGLRARGAVVDEVAAYRTLPAPAGAERLLALLRTGGIDAITFTSSSTVRYLLDGLDAAGLDRAEAWTLLGRVAVVCIGPITAATAHQEGVRVDAIALEYTTGGLVEALVKWFAQPGTRAKGARA